MQQMVYHHKISDTDQLKQVLINSWAQLSQCALNQAIDQRQGKGWSCWISSRLIICVRDCPSFTVFLMKIEQNSNSLQFWWYWRFMQIRQRIFNCTDMQITYFILDKILKLSTYYMPFYHQSLQSYLISKTVRFFGPPYLTLNNGESFKVIENGTSR